MAETREKYWPQKRCKENRFERAGLRPFTAQKNSQEGSF